MTSDAIDNKYNEGYYLLSDFTVRCTQSDQCFETGKYAINVTSFAADFSSIKDTRATGAFATEHFNKIP